MHEHEHRHAEDRRALAIALALIVAFLIGEVVAAIVAGSLALLADAGHMLTDAGALAFALFAATLAGRPAQGESINVRGAFLHVATDTVAFAGTAVAGGLILATGWDRFDSIASIGVAALMLWASWGLLHESASIFLERSPDEIEPDAVGRAIVAEPDVVEVHDLHVWTVTSGFSALAAHVLVAPDADCHAIRRRLERMLHEQFALEHTTLQVDHAEPRLLTIERR